MQLRLRNVARRAQLTNKLSGLHALSSRNIDAIGMRIGRDEAIIVLDQEKITKAPELVSDISHRPCFRRTKRRAAIACDVDAVIALAIRTGSKT